MSKQRIPRIQGLTYLDKSNKKQVKKHILLHYIQNNFTINGVYMNLQQVANYIQVPMKEVMIDFQRLTDVINKRLGKLINEDTASGVIFQAQMGAWQTYHQATEQLNLLALSQNGQYQAFMSKEVNSAMSNVIQSMKLIADMAKLIQPTKPTVNVINNNNQAMISATYVGPDEALKLVEAQVAKSAQLQLGSEAHIRLLEASNSLYPDSIPNILSNAQSEEAIMAQTIKARSQKEADELSAMEERQFRDFKTVDEADIADQ